MYVVKGEDKAMDEKNEDRFDSAAEGVCERIRKSLRGLPPDVKKQAQEIRLRVNRPVTVCCPQSVYFLKESGGLGCIVGPGCVRADKNDLEESFRTLCGNSVYSHETEIKNGYVTLRGGHRAGICGTAVYQNGTVSGMRDISSINIRVAREIPGSADLLLNRLKDTLSGGLLLAGPPSSGKTTILRDIARQLASGVRGNIRKVAVVDERGEIAGSYQGIPQNDVGICCDVLDGYPKAEGILLAVRSLSPQYIVCDELGSEEETRAVEQSLNAGVSVIASIHAGNAEELLRRRQAAALLETGAFASAALLDGSAKPGKIVGIYRAGDLLAENRGSASAHRRGLSRGICGIA
jgi:stage III sporulation protein AA